MKLARCFLLLACFCASSYSFDLARKVTINGYSSFEFEKQLGEDGKGDPNASFDADMFDIVFNFQPTDRLRIVADLTWEHGSQSESGLGNVGLEYAFPEFTVFNWLKLRAGKMLLPFGIYNEIHTAKPTFLSVKEPFSTNKTEKFGAKLRLYPRWGAGISALGNIHIRNIMIDYNLLLSNGQQDQVENPFEADENLEKAVTGRVRVSPLQGLRVGASVYYDNMTEFDEVVDGEETATVVTTGGDTVDIVTAAGELSLEDSGARLSYVSYGGQLEYTLGDFGIELEGISGYYMPSSTDAKISRWGATAMVYYTLFNRFTPFFRYEIFDPNQDKEDDRAMQFVYGVNINVNSHLFLKFDFNTVNADPGNSRFKNGNNKYTEIKSAVTVGF